MELQELVERIQRWKERTSPGQVDSYNYNIDDIVEEMVPTEEISGELRAELLDTDFVEEVSEVDLVEGSMDPGDISEEDDGESDV
jgi:hypothetical protein